MRRCEIISQQTSTDSVGQWVKREVTKITWGEHKQSEIDRTEWGMKTNVVICVYTTIQWVFTSETNNFMGGFLSNIIYFI